jgi:predicted ATPase
VEVTDVADARIWKAFVESYLTEDDLESEKKNTKKREKDAKKRNILVCTSNFKPKQLYKGGLNWKSLLVSEVLSERLDAVSLDGEEHESPEKFRDYRKASFAAEEASARKIEGETSSLLSSSSSMIFGDDADASLRLHWEKLMLSSKNRSKRHHHALSDRLEKDIRSAATSIEANAKAAYFDFAALCGANAKWSPKDYENLSKAYEFVFLESIPVLDVAILGEDVVRRFVMVIDALYANKTKLYCSSPSTKSIADLFPQSSSTPSRENSSSSTATATTTFVSKTGGASGRNATMLSENIEWSATGLTKASLAALSSGSFTDKSKPRCQSRLYEMKTEAYKRDRPA